MYQSIRNGKLLYHSTLIYNVPSITCDGLYSRSIIESNNYNFCDIADHNILDGRQNLSYDLPQFVPFHFFPRTPFEKSICQSQGTENIAIISIYRPNRDEMRSYKVAPAHPLSKYNKGIFSYEDGIKKIDWDTLDDYDKNYNNYTYDNYVHNAVMAECLVPEMVMPKDIAFIYVSSENAKNRILDELNQMYMPYSLNIYNKITVNANMFPKLYNCQSRFSTYKKY